MIVQIFGTRKSSDTRGALRFFSERRVQVHFVDVREKAPAPGELKRFVQKFGVDALLDRESRRFQDLGLQAARLSDERWLDKMCLEPDILRLPLARWGKYLTIGAAETDWKAWVAEARNSAPQST